MSFDVFWGKLIFWDHCIGFYSKPQKSEFISNNCNYFVMQAFRFYLGVQPAVGNWAPTGNEFSLIWDQTNPIGDFVEFPDNLRGLQYSRVLCGAIRGGLEMVQIDVGITIAREFLLGDSATELRIRFNKRLEDALPIGED